MFLSKTNFVLCAFLATIFSSCFSSEADKSYLSKGQSAVRLSATIDNYGGNDLTGDARDLELTYEWATSDQVTYLASLGHRSWESDASIGDVDSLELGIGSRRYFTPTKNIHPYAGVGLGYADFSGNDYAFDLNWQLGIVVPWKSVHFDLGYGFGTAFLKKDGGILDALDRSQRMLMIGIGYSF